MATDPKLSTPSSSSSSHPHGLVPLPAKPGKFESSGLRRTKSRNAVKASVKANASTREASVNDLQQSLENAVTQTTGETLHAVDAVMDEAGAPGARRAAGKANSRTSRRRALVLCLALGMVRPCASSLHGSLQGGSELRRTVSESVVRRTTASAIVSQVSLATALKQTNLLGEQEDLQKLTTLQ
jgi:hypothetical protein